MHLARPCSFHRCNYSTFDYMHTYVHDGSTRVVSSLLRVLPLLTSSQVTEGVQAGPSVGEMSERSQKLEEEIEAMSSQLHATAAS